MGSGDSSEGEEGADNWFVKGLCQKSDRETATINSGSDWSKMSRGGRVQYGMCCWLVQSQESVWCDGQAYVSKR